MEQDRNLRSIIIRYQDELCYFKQMQILAMSPDEKNYYLNLINERTEAFIQYIEQYGTKALEADVDTNNQTELEQTVFTLDDLANYNGSQGKPSYVAVNGTVYDMSNEIRWSGGMHFGLIAGKDLTTMFMGCHSGMTAILDKLPKVGVLKK